MYAGNLNVWKKYAHIDNNRYHTAEGKALKPRLTLSDKDKFDYVRVTTKNPTTVIFWNNFRTFNCRRQGKFQITHTGTDCISMQYSG
jgi:hypothetical protein